MLAERFNYIELWYHTTHHQQQQQKKHYAKEEEISLGAVRMETIGQKIAAKRLGLSKMNSGRAGVGESEQGIVWHQCNARNTSLQRKKIKSGGAKHKKNLITRCYKNKIA